MGGDYSLRPPHHYCNVGGWRNRRRQLISPLAGEMSGRTEGGDVGRSLGEMNTLSQEAQAHQLSYCSSQVSAQLETAQRGLSAMFFTLSLATEMKLHSATLMSGRSSATFFWNSL